MTEADQHRSLAAAGFSFGDLLPRISRLRGGDLTAWLGI
jgi:hypothetical protein